LAAKFNNASISAGTMELLAPKRHCSARLRHVKIFWEKGYDGLETFIKTLLPGLKSPQTEKVAILPAARSAQTKASAATAGEKAGAVLVCSDGSLLVTLAATSPRFIEADN
jgi:hypothetical protein